MEPLTASAVSGLTEIQQLGIAGIFLSLLLIGGIFMLKYFMNDCQKRQESAINMWREDAKENRSVIEKNTEAWHGMQIAVVKLESKIEATK